MDGSTARAVLGVGPSANRADIEIAFRSAAKRAHPDAGGTSDGFRQLCQARTLLRRVAPAQPLPFLHASSLEDAGSWGVPRRPRRVTRSFAEELRIAEARAGR